MDRVDIRGTAVPAWDWVSEATPGLVITTITIDIIPDIITGTVTVGAGV